jgi:antitoxin component YwqK of YwqJK toxin-antitoxin module
MKIKLLIISILVAFIAKAQEEDNCGIIIDEVKVENVNCWSFDHLYAVFPIRENYKSFSYISLRVLWNNVEFQVNDEDFTYAYGWVMTFTPDQMATFFPGALYGVWKLLPDKSDMSQMKYRNFNWPSGIKSRSDLANYGKIDKSYVNAYFMVEVIGYNAIQSVDGSRNILKGNGVILYKSKKIPTTSCAKKCDFDPNSPCTLPGNKFNLKVEDAGGYKENLGLIKSGSSSNSGASGSKGEPALSGTMKTKTTNTGIPYTEKHDNGKISIQGQKNKEGNEEGLWKYFDETGKLEKQINYSNGIQDGETKLYDKGKLFKTQVYKQGELLSEKDN